LEREVGSVLVEGVFGEVGDVFGGELSFGRHGARGAPSLEGGGLRAWGEGRDQGSGGQGVGGRG
jgi:hypothetical protein